jgi:hypothetical protein
MARRPRLTLSKQESAALEEHRDHHPSPQRRERCTAILKVAEGKAPYWVARQGLLKPRCPNTLYTWVRLYRTRGLEGLIAYAHGGVRRRRL